MTLGKRWLILKATLFGQWHQKTCAECSFTWWSQGRFRPELIDMCDACESENIDQTLASLDRRYHMHLEYERIQRLKRRVNT